MPYDATSRVADAGSTCPLNGIDIAPVLALLSQEDAAHARLALALGFVTEPLLAFLAQVQVATLRDWKVDRKGPASQTFGNAILYPIAEVERALTEWAGLPHAAVRSRRR